MINYIVYGNTDYLDVLEIQTDYIIGCGNVTLFLNNNDLDLEILTSKYDKVIYYDNGDTYSKRLLSCIQQIDEDYFLLLHDIDILLNVDNIMIKKFYDFLRVNNFDRIDLKHSDNKISNLIVEYNSNKKPIEWGIKLSEELTDDVYLIKQDNPYDFIYNVNPSIWKRDSLIKLLSNFTHKNYRTIEEMDVQLFSKQFKIFKLTSNSKKLCGYFNCVDGFQFLHISHSGKLLPLNENFVTTYGQSYVDVSDEYVKIVNKYNLTKSNKWIK